MTTGIRAAIALISTVSAVAAQAQDAPVSVAPAKDVCELRVFPTENYIGINTGLLSGFGIVGAVADLEAHKGRVATVKDLMAGYLGPDIQMEELNKIGLIKTLGLAPDTRIIIEAPTPSADDAKANPAVKTAAKAMNATIKSGKRLTTSTNPCYSELILFNVFYHKAMMYGSNLFVGTMYRDFSAVGKPPVVSAGAVKNPLEHFPPQSPDMVDAAKAELRGAFAKDFIEWSDKKLKKGQAAASK